jgi:REP element-mobilizing transposase RayT
MPNHAHGIIIVGATLAVAPTLVATQDNGAGARPAPTIGDIVGMFKSLCVYDWLRYIKENRIDAIGKFWQRNYYEHIIRNEDRLNKIREYIINNPLKWSLDRENPDRCGSDNLEEEVFSVPSKSNDTST